MTAEPVKQLALGLVGCEVADQSAFGCVFPELFDLRQIVLHRRCPAFRVPELRSGNKRESIQTNELGHSDNATPPSVETVAGGAESLSREGLTNPGYLLVVLPRQRFTRKWPASVNRRALLSSVFGNERDARRVDAGAS